MIGLPVLAPDTYDEISSRYEEQDPETHLPASYTPELVEGYRQQQAVFARLMRSPNTTINEMMMMGPGGSIQNLHPVSRGTVTLNPEDPEGEVIVDYRAASNEIDLELMAENIRFMRRYMAADELSKYEPTETYPGSSYDSIEKLTTWVRGQIIPSVYHPVGSCAKTPREHGGCVDEQLRVYGTSRLSVVDASIMPTNVAATTQMTVYAIAEKAADIIKARAKKNCKKAH
jgi:choline dehydrogenase-like flavoprotein